MASARVLARLDALIWVLVYAGLFAIVFGVVLRSQSAVAAWTLGILGALATIGGAVLLWLRSRMAPETAAGPPPPSPQGKT